MRWPSAPLAHAADEGLATALWIAQTALKDHHQGVDRRALQAQAQEKKKAKRRKAREDKKNAQKSQSQAPPGPESFLA